MGVYGQTGFEPKLPQQMTKPGHGTRSLLSGAESGWDGVIRLLLRRTARTILVLAASGPGSALLALPFESQTQKYKNTTRKDGDFVWLECADIKITNVLCFQRYTELRLIILVRYILRLVIRRSRWQFSPESRPCSLHLWLH